MDAPLTEPTRRRFDADSTPIATAGLALVVFALARTGHSSITPSAVGAYIGAAYVTSSTSFADPAITVGRTLSDSFAGIAPASAPAFVAAQAVGGVAGYAAIKVPYPGRGIAQVWCHACR